MRQVNRADAERNALIQDVMMVSKLMASLAQDAILPFWMELDITMGQLKALFTLATSESATVSQIADSLGIGRSAASLLVDRMVQDALVERAEDTQDRRRAVVRLSPRGQELVARLRQARQTQRGWLEKLDNKDLQALRQGLGALAAVARAETADTKKPPVPLEEFE